MADPAGAIYEATGFPEQEQALWGDTRPVRRRVQQRNGDPGGIRQPLGAFVIRGEAVA